MIGNCNEIGPSVSVGFIHVGCKAWKDYSCISSIIGVADLGLWENHMWVNCVSAAFKMLPFWGGKCLPLRFIRVTRLRTETNRPLGGCLMGYIHRNPWSIHSFNYVCVERSTNNVVSIHMCVYVCKCNRVWEYFSWQPHPKLIPPTISPTSPLLPPLLFDTISFWLNDWTCHGQSRTHESS